MTGTKQIQVALSGIALTALVGQSSLAAGTKPLPIEKIGMDQARQLVVQFASQPGAFPSVPNVLDMPGPNHRIVLEFADATIDKANIASPDAITAAMAKVLPIVRGVRYSNVANAAKPIVRIVIDLPETLKVQPRVVKLEESSVTINLGEAVQNLKAQTEPNTKAAAADTGAPVPSRPEPEAAAAIGSTTADTTPTIPEASAPAVTSSASEGAPVASAPVAATTVATTEVASTPELKPAVTQPAGTATGGWDWTSPGAVASKSSAPIREVSETNVAQAPEAPEATKSPIRVIDEDPKLTPPMGKGDTPQATPAAEAVSKPAADAIKPTEEAQSTPAHQAETASGKTEGAPAPAEGETPAASAPAAASTPAVVEEEGPKSATSAQAAVKLYNAAVRNHLSGKLEEAITDYKGALAANPALAEAHSNLGLIYNQQHNYQGALSEFHKALAINPKDAITYNGIGAALRAEKDLLGAIRNWQTAVDIDPKLATAHYNLGTAYEIQKEYDKALEAYKDAVQNDYRLGEAYYRMGLIMLRNKRLDDAAAQFKEALKVSSNSEYSEDAKVRLASLKTQKK